MEYVEIQRAKRVLFWYGAVVLAIVAIALIAIFSGTHGSRLHHGGGTEDTSALVGVSSFGGLLVATFVASALSSEAATAPIIWTRPRRREEMALRYVAVDVATIILGYLMLFAAMIFVTAVIGALPAVRFDAAETAGAFGIGLGACLMWYALVSLVAVRLPARGGLIAGLSWPAFLILGALYAAPLPNLLHDLVYALNYLSPLAWLDLGSSSSHDQIIPFSEPVRILGTWLIALAATAASIRLWSTREA
jgi:hypothetical protein